MLFCFPPIGKISKPDAKIMDDEWSAVKARLAARLGAPDPHGGSLKPHPIYSALTSIPLFFYFGNIWPQATRMERAPRPIRAMPAAAGARPAQARARRRRASASTLFSIFNPSERNGLHRPVGVGTE